MCPISLISFILQDINADLFFFTRFLRINAKCTARLARHAQPKYGNDEGDKEKEQMDGKKAPEPRRTTPEREVYTHFTTATDMYTLQSRVVIQAVDECVPISFFFSFSLLSSPLFSSL